MLVFLNKLTEQQKKVVINALYASSVKMPIYLDFLKLPTKIQNVLDQSRDISSGIASIHAKETSGNYDVTAQKVIGDSIVCKSSENVCELLKKTFGSNILLGLFQERALYREIISNKTNIGIIDNMNIDEMKWLVSRACGTDKTFLITSENIDNLPYELKDAEQIIMSKNMTTSDLEKEFEGALVVKELDADKVHEIMDSNIQALDTVRLLSDEEQADIDRLNSIFEEPQEAENDNLTVEQDSARSVQITGIMNQVRRMGNRPPEVGSTSVFDFRSRAHEIRVA